MPLRWITRLTRPALGGNIRHPRRDAPGSAIREGSGETRPGTERIAPDRHPRRQTTAGGVSPGPSETSEEGVRGPRRPPPTCVRAPVTVGRHADLLSCRTSTPISMPWTRCSLPQATWTPSGTSVTWSATGRIRTASSTASATPARSGCAATTTPPPAAGRRSTGSTRRRAGPWSGLGAAISPSTLAWLSALPERRTLEGCELVHGSPREPLWEYVTSVPVARANLALLTDPIGLHGHTHLPVAFLEEDGRVDVVGPGPGSELELREPAGAAQPGQRRTAARRRPRRVVHGPRPGSGHGLLASRPV